MAPPNPPFTLESATMKVKKAQDLWNTMNPIHVAQAYTVDSTWRNRDQFFEGRKAIVDFLTRKWAVETNYKLKKTLFAFEGNRIAVQFWYEFFHVQEDCWKRTYGLEHWTFNDNGLMRKRHMSANDVTITESERWFREGVDVDQVVVSDVHG